MYLTNKSYRRGIQFLMGAFLACVVALIVSLPSFAATHVTYSHLPLTTVQKAVFSLPSRECAMLAQAYPKGKRQTELCTIALTSTSTILSNATPNVSASSNGCPRASIYHESTLNGPLGGLMYSAHMRETFHWNGDCSPPTVTNQNCAYDEHTIFPYTSIQPSYCGSWNDDAGNSIAESDYAIGTAGGTFTNNVQAIASGHSTTISDVVWQ